METQPETTAEQAPETSLGFGTILFGVLCQVAVILWIIRSEVPGKVVGHAHRIGPVPAVRFPQDTARGQRPSLR